MDHLNPEDFIALPFLTPERMKQIIFNRAWSNIKKEVAKIKCQETQGAA